MKGGSMNQHQTNHKPKFDVIRLIINILLGMIIGALGILINDEIRSITLTQLPFLIVLFFIALFFTVLNHELGHLCCGLLSGYRFSSFLVLSFFIKKNQSNRLTISLHKVPGAMGQCIMIPPETKPLPVFWYNSGGVIFDFIAALILIPLMISTQSHWLSLFFYLCLAFSLGSIVMNWFPLGAQANDGSNYRNLINNEVNKEAMYEHLRLVSKINNGERITTQNFEPLRNLNLRGDDMLQINHLKLLFLYDLLCGNLQHAQDTINKVNNSSHYLNGVTRIMTDVEYYFIKRVLNDNQAGNYRTKEVDLILHKVSETKKKRINEELLMIYIVDAYIDCGKIDAVLYEKLRMQKEISNDPGIVLDCLDFVDWFVAENEFNVSV